MPDIRSDMIQCHVCRHSLGGGFEHLLLQRAANEKVYPGIWQVITGSIEEGESAVQAALRELREETGLAAESMYSVPYTTSFYSAHDDSVCLVPVFAAIVAHDADVRLSEEHQRFLWLPPDPAHEKLLLPSHREALRVAQHHIFSSEADAGLFSISTDLFHTQS